MRAQAHALIRPLADRSPNPDRLQSAQAGSFANRGRWRIAKASPRARGRFPVNPIRRRKFSAGVATTPQMGAKMRKMISAALGAGLLLAGCASVPAMQNVATISDPAARDAAYAQLQAAAPKPIEGNTGAYMSPFTSDGVTAEWVTKSMQVKSSGQVGQAVGQIAGDQLLSNIPFAGLFAGKATKALARSAALKSIGGEEFVKSSSDLSFANLNDMAAYMYAFHSSHAEYARIVDATGAIYPEFQEVYFASYPAP